jgi:glycosyltransferase involved in cell wall biosynthesis
MEGILAARYARVPVVIHGEHGDVVCRSKADVYWQRLLWNRTDQVLSVSETLKRELCRTIGFAPHRIKVVPNGVDAQRFRPLEDSTVRRAEFAGTPDELVIGTVGHLAAVKDYPTLLRAVGVLHGRGIPCRTIIAGEGEERATLQQLATDLSIRDRVILTGKRDDVPELLNTFDVFALPSLHEGMPNAVMEAMACGIPVVATRVGGVPELITDGLTGFLTTPRDAGALADVLTSLARDRHLRRRVGAAGRERILGQFTLDRMVGTYSANYIDVVTQKRN